jgi:hypothetical protein
MIILTPERARVLAETTESPPRVVDPQTRHIYFLVTGEVYARAQALFEEEQEVLGMYPHLAELEPKDWQEGNCQSFAYADQSTPWRRPQASQNSRER